jgi:hypothetical protein
MLDRITATLKAVLGITMLVIGTFYAAQKLDRERGEEATRDAAYVRDPSAVGAIVPRLRTPGGPTQLPAR